LVGGDVGGRIGHADIVVIKIDAGKSVSPLSSAIDARWSVRAPPPGRGLAVLPARVVAAERGLVGVRMRTPRLIPRVEMLAGPAEAPCSARPQRLE
jgi:hypothetical protein